MIQRKCSCGGSCSGCAGKEEEELGIQPKLTVGPANDVYEQEADRVADQVMRLPDFELQRQKHGGGAVQSPPRIISATNFIGEGGQSLPDSVLSYFEPRFGYDFSRLLTHTGAQAAVLARAVNAKAFTIGRDMIFGVGQYAPGTTQGELLLAHELTHAVQQGAVPPLGTGHRESARSTAFLPQVSRARPHVIQREVSADLVNSSTESLSRIATRITTADRHADSIVRFIDARQSLGLMEPTVRQAITNLVRLLELAFEFNPGAAKDSPRNRFVYNCRCGWIDMGHFFFSALAAYLAGLLLRFSSLPRTLPVVPTPSEVSLALGFLVEELQDAVRRFVSGLPSPLQSLVPEGIRGIMRSAYTIEDLPSDAFGAAFGQEVWEATAISSTTGTITAALLGAAPFDIYGRMARFFSGCQAVLPTGSTLEAMMEETSPGGTPRRHPYTTPFLLTSAGPLCP